MAETQADRNILWAKMVARSWEDSDYRSRLLDDPRAALVEAGLDVAPEVKVTISACEPDELHLVLPPKPAISEMELDDEALVAAVGGGTCSTGCSACGSSSPPTMFGGF